MAHNIATNSNGAASFYSLKVNPWHNLGRVVDKPLADPAVLDAAGLNWKAEKVGMYTTDMDVVPRYMSIRRSDDKRILGVVGEKYEPLQNADMIAFFREIAGKASMTVETAGALGDGETVWVLARIPGLELAKGDDISHGYMLIRNNHDGNACVRVSPTMIRVVCANTLAMADGERSKRTAKHGRNTLSGGWAIRHTEGIKRAMADVADAYARTLIDYAATREAFSALTGKPLSTAALDKIMAAAFAASSKVEDSTESKRAESIAKARRERILAIAASATCNVTGTAGTLWAGLNAVTEYVDHEARTRVTDGQSDNVQRFESSAFGGNGAKVKAKAWEAALALV